MDIVDCFGSIVDHWSESSPLRARKLLLAGWKAQNLKNKYAPDKALAPSAIYLAQIMMDAMTAPLEKSEQSVMVSVFTPCELMQAFGLHPFNPEGFSCYISGSHAEGPFISEAEADGISESFCSYHKIFLGAAQKGLMPKPKCVVSTNLACDANQLTFRRLAEYYNIPHFSIDVPINPCEDAVNYVADQLKELKVFLEKVENKPLSEDILKENVARSRKTADLYREYMMGKADKMILQDLVTPLYEFVIMHILLGTPQAEEYVRMANQENMSAPSASGIRLFWLHTNPYWQESINNLLRMTPNVQIVGSDMPMASMVQFDPEKPYEAMARRLVYNSFNGNVQRRIQLGIEHAKELNSDGAVWFCHWGCKHTLGGAALAKKQFEEAGIPLLILDGDGCDRSKGGDGQTATRLGAFLEMLEEKKHEQ